METVKTSNRSGGRRGGPVWVRDELQDGLRRLAKRDGETVAYHARRAIEAYLKKHDKPTLEVRA